MRKIQNTLPYAFGADLSPTLPNCCESTRLEAK